MDLAIDGRSALVTAASEGLGFAAAMELARGGAGVAITGRRTEVLEAAADAIREETGSPVVALPGDITERDAPDRAVAAAVERLGALDILVANAGGPPPRRALEVTDEEVTAAIEANLLTSVRLVRAARPHLAASSQGRICCIASVSVVQPIPSLALSNLARAGLWGWAKTAAQDLRPDGVTLNLVCPGPHRTARAARVGLQADAGDPEDFGAIVAFMCSRATGFLTGTTIVVDGGMTLGL